MQAAVLLLHYASPHGDAPFPADAAQRLSETGTAMLLEALLWLDQISPHGHAALDRQPAAHDWQSTLVWHLDSFWYGWPRIFPALVQSLQTQEPASELLAALVDTVLRLLLERPVWRESSMSSRLDALETLVGLAPGQPQQRALHRGQLLLIHNRYHPASIEHGRANDFLDALKALEKPSLQAFLQALAHTGTAFHFRIPESTLPTPTNAEVVRAQLHDAIDAGISLHHTAVTWADLLLLAARTHLPPAAVAQLSEPLHGILEGELRSLQLHFGCLVQGRQTQDFKSLLTNVPKQWSVISADQHGLLTARRLQKFYLHPDGVPRAFEMRVQRLCSALRNLCHVVQAQAALDPVGSEPEPAVLALGLRLQSLFSLWPTKPGKRTLLSWLKQ